MPFPGTACTDEALITITDSLLDQSSKSGKKNKGLPGYTYCRAPGERWRSRFDIEKNVIVIINGHGDFVYAGKQKSRKLRYICRLFCKELVRHNFPGMQVDEMLEEKNPKPPGRIVAKTEQKMDESYWDMKNGVAVAEGEAFADA